MTRHTSIAAVLVVLAALLTLSACGRGNKAADSAAPPLIRTPMPTFTPTSPAAAAPQQSAPAVQPLISADAAPALDAADAPQTIEAIALDIPSPEPQGIGGPMVELPEGGIPPVAVINTELVNSRTGPDTTYPVATVLGRGEDFDITGKSSDGAWLRVCCLVDLQEVWISAEFADSDGSIDNVPVAQAGETSALALARQNGAARVVAAATAVPAPVAEAPAPAPEPVAQPAPQPAAEAAPSAQAAQAEAVPAAPAAEVAVAAVENAGTGGFELSGQEAFPETNVVRVFLYVYAENQGLEGYTLRVTKDGVEQTVAGASFGGQPGMTWPIADERQRFQNFKVEFPGVEPAGVWSVELIEDGAVVGPAATFNLVENDTARELYVRYKRN